MRSLLLLSFAAPVWAASEASLAIMAENVLKDLGGADGPFMKFFWAFTILAGGILVIKGLLSLKEREGVSGAITAIIIGSLIISFPLTLATFNHTIFQNQATTSILSDVPTSGSISATARSFIKFAVFAIQVVGFISLYKGLRTFADQALTRGRDPDRVRFAWMFIFAGILCINILWTLRITANTLGGEALKMYQLVFG